MISKVHRFHGRGALNFVYQKGRAVRGESISLRYAPNKRPDYRMAVVVSRKVSKSAVVRNRIRRRIYEIVRTEKKAASGLWPYDLVFSVFDDSIAAANQENLRAAILRLLQKSNII